MIVAHPRQANEYRHENIQTCAAVVVLLCAFQGAGARRVETAGASPILGILQSELQRNMQVLNSRRCLPISAYPVRRAEHAEGQASFGAIERSDENHQRFATVEVRVGDYVLDNTHPIRGDARAMGPRLSQVSLLPPMTTSRSAWPYGAPPTAPYKTVTEELTRVQTNVAAKVKEEDPAPDFSREEPQTYSGPAVNYTLDQKAWEVKLRRVSALFIDDPLIQQRRVADRRGGQPLLHQQRRLPDCRAKSAAGCSFRGGHESAGRHGAAAAPQQLFCDLSRRVARRKQPMAGCAQHDGAAGPPRKAPPGGWPRARPSWSGRVPPACSSTRSSVIASKPTGSATWTTPRRFPENRVVGAAILSASSLTPRSEMGNVELMGITVRRRRRQRPADDGGGQGSVEDIPSWTLRGLRARRRGVKSTGTPGAEPGYLSVDSSRIRGGIVEERQSPTSQEHAARDEAKNRGSRSACCSTTSKAASPTPSAAPRTPSTCVAECRVSHLHGRPGA